MTRKKGKIIKWNDDKGFGFILSVDSQKNIFVHIKSFTDRNVRPAENQIVTYTVQNNDNGKDSAINVSRSTDNPIRSRTNSSNIKKIIPKHKWNNKNNISLDQKSTHSISPFYSIFILSFMVFLFHFFLEGRLPFFVIIVYIVMGIITYFVYAGDKLQAIDNERRISEQLLLTLSLFGGWIGALIAQQRFRHKTKKTSFQISFWITVAFNILLLASGFKIIHF